MATSLRAAAAAATCLLAITTHVEALRINKNNKIIQEAIQGAVVKTVTAKTVAAPQRSSQAKSADQIPRSGCMDDGMCVYYNGGSVVIYKEADSSTQAKVNKEDIKK